jgi:biopolymer transport protein ExbB
MLPLLALLSLTASARVAQETDTRPDFDAAAGELEHDLAEALDELARLREEIAAEQIPLNRRLSDLEAELSGVRADFQQASRELDGRTLDLSNLRGDIKTRGEESAYLGSLLSEYIRNFESRLHITELARYEAALQAAKLALENSGLEEHQVLETQAGLLTTALERLHEALGGARFAGTAVDETGLVKTGHFVLLGPAAIFAADDGSTVGTAEQRLGSLEPAALAFEDPLDRAAAEKLVASSAGELPLDPTLGNAHKVAATEETLVEHFLRGGPVMWPILGLASAALLVGLYKWLRLAFVRKPSQAEIKALLATVARRDKVAATAAAQALRGPTGAMLRTGVEHLGEPHELIEEVMYEQVLATRLKLQRMLPFVAITASSAPLLGLLGTVTGIMNTFTLMTVFGTGDIKTLSSGISEALITTEYGLYVAIPSLLLSAYLARKTKGVIDQMEKAAIALVNQVAKTPYRTPESELAQSVVQPVRAEVAAPVA